MTPAPKRRWFAYSLRALFVVVTAVSLLVGWFTWEAQIVRHRQTVRRRLEAAGAIFFAGGMDWHHSPFVRLVRPHNDQHSISALRRLLGDRSIDLIAFNRQLTPDDRQAIETFPEAEIHGIP
jgi:hypothetical protein